MKDDEKLLKVLQFLALDSGGKLACLPKFPIGEELEIFRTNYRSDNPLFCIGYECFDCIERNKLGPDEASQILADMEALLDEMIGHEKGWWIWSVEEPGLARSTHFFWRILRRLAIEVLNQRNLPDDVPTIELTNFITVGRWVPTRKNEKRTARK
jgi:hypothetical protein